MRFPLLALAALTLVACEAEPDTAPPDATTTAAPEAPEVATETSRVTVDYRGTLPDGTVFDEGDGISFSLQEVVDGFRTNISGMTEGETKTFVVPPEEGYGEFPPPGIPTDTDLTFEVTLHEVQ